MTDKQVTPKIRKLDPSLSRWCDTAAPTERKSVVLRIGFSTDPNVAAAELSRHGAIVKSAGPGTIIATVTAGSVPNIVACSWLLEMTEPRPLDQMMAPRV
jgi:hypothetical protein